MATKLDLDLLNLFWSDLHNPRTWKNYKGDRRNLAKDTYARYRQILSQARPFSIDDAALKVAFKLSLEPSETLARRLILARLPFPKTWIEFDFRTKLKLSEENGTSPGIEPGTPLRIGYLLEESKEDPQIWAVTTVVQPNDEEEPSSGFLENGTRTEISCVTWMVDTLNRSPPLRVGPFKELDRKFCQGMVQDELNLDAGGFPSVRHLGWGYAPPTPVDGVNPMRVLAVPEALYNTINVGMTPLLQGMFEGMMEHGDPGIDRMREIILNSAVESRGDVRILVAMLSLINEVPIIKELRRPSGKVNLGGSFRPYLQNNIVRIDLPTKRYMTVVRSILRNAQIRAKARHEVRGHWRTIVHKKGHERVIKKPDGTIDRVYIHQGELEKVWVESHERGDANLGYVKHKYLVDKGRGNDRPLAT